MASYQDIDVRLVGVENALAFLMKTMRIREMVGSKFDAEPLIREMSMYDYYREQLGRGLLEQAGVPAEQVDDLVNELETSSGTDSADAAV
jgi:hypothetical protein